MNGKKIGAFFLAIIVGGIGGFIATSVIIEIIKTNYQSCELCNANWLMILAWIILGILLGLICYKIVKENSRCYECREPFSTDHIKTKILNTSYISKDVKINKNNKDIYVRKSYRVELCEEYYKCTKCGYSYTRTRERQTEV